VIAVRVALRALGGNKLRTTLTMLGIIVGVAAVIALTAVGKGAQAQITAQIESMGKNLLFVRPGSTTSGTIQGGAGSSPTLSLDDADAVRRLPGVGAVAPETGGQVQLVANGTNYSTFVRGVTADYASVRNARTAAGSWITAQQVDERSSVIVLGSTVARKLFGSTDPVGQTLRATAGNHAGTVLRVVGVTEAKGAGGLGDQDDLVFMPLTTVQSQLQARRTPGGEIAVATINVQVASERQMAEVMAQIGVLLRTRHQVTRDDFTVQSQQEILRSIAQVSGTFTLLLGAVASISLFVGGVGIMNTMLITVRERTREIGIRKAVGARRLDILLQFLTESTVVSVLGGCVGITCGVGIALAVGRLGMSGLLPIPGGERIAPLVGVDSVAVAFAVSAAVGLFFGVYPALHAARLQPTDALRAE
jgi:putative ABC transport system permease protein